MSISFSDKMRYLAIFQSNKCPELKGFVNPDPDGTSSCHIFKATGDVEVIGLEDKEFRVKLIAGEVMEHESLYGPASLRDKTLIYPCTLFKCRVGCACKMCRNKLTNCEDFKDHEAYHKSKPHYVPILCQSRECNPSLSLQDSF